MSDTHSEPRFRVSICARHVHLSTAHVHALFGEGYALTPLSDLSQPFEYACAETVTVRGPDGEIDDVRVIGPTTSHTRIELPVRDHGALGLDATLRLSRTIDGSEGCTLAGPAGTVVLAEGVVNALRHLRVSPELAAELGLEADGTVSIHVGGDRARVFTEVVVSVEPGAIGELCLDTEEAAAVDVTPDTWATVKA